MTTKATAGLRTSYKVVKSLESVYSGGPVVMSKDGTFIAATREQDIVLYSTTHQRILYVLSTPEEDESDITSLCLRDDSSLLVSAHASHQIREWDLPTLAPRLFTPSDPDFSLEAEVQRVTQPTKAWKLPSAYVASMAFDRTGSLLALGCTDARIRVWEVNHGYYTHSFRIPGGGVITSLGFCPFPGVDAKRPVLVSAGDDYVVRVWDLASKSGSELRGHQSTVSVLGFAGDKYVLSAGRDNVVNVWDIYENRNAATIPAFEGLLGLAAVDVAGKTFVYGAGERGVVKVWSLDAALSGASISPVWVQKGSDDSDNNNDSNDDDDDDDDEKTSYTAMQYSVGSDTLLLVTSEQNLYLYKDIVAAVEEEVFLQDTPAAVVGNRDQVADLQYVTQDRIVVVDNSERPQLIDLSSGTASVLEGHTDLVLCVAVFIPNKAIKSTNSNNNGDGEEDIEMSDEEGGNNNNNNNVDNEPLVVTGSKDRLVRLWSGKTGKCLGVFEGHTGSISAVALFGNKIGKVRLLSASNDTTMKLWDIPEGGGDTDGPDSAWKQTKSRYGVRAHDKDINSIAVAPNDKVIATGSQDRLVKLWNAETLTPIATLTGHRRGVWSVAFSPIDQVLASASADGTVRLWSLASHQCLKTFEGHSGPVLRCAFATRGMQILSAGADALVKLWTIKTGECAGTFDSQHTDRIWALALRPGDDGAAFATAGADSVINLWEDCTAEVLEAERAEHDRKVLQRHELDAHLRSGEYRKALDAAFALGHPRQVLHILDTLRGAQESNGDNEDVEEEEEKGGMKKKEKKKGPLEEAVEGLSEDNVRVLFGYLVDWNTNAKHAATAQAVLNVVFRLYDFESLKGILKPETFKKTLEALIPYSQRHMAHCNGLLQRSRIIDYTYATFSSMDAMAVEEEEEEEL